MPKDPQVPNAASNLLGIALVITAGIDVTHIADKSLSDEVAKTSVIALLGSCLWSYLAMRHSRLEPVF